MVHMEVIVLPLMFAALGWVLLSLVETFLRYRRAVLMVRIQEKMLDRFTTAEEIATIFGGQAGKRFVESLSHEPLRPQQKILRALQIGIVFGCLGLGFLGIGPFVPGGEPAMFVVGGLVLALGTGFAISSYIAHRLSLAWGVYGQAATEKEL